MSCILHIETSTEVCSVAVSQDGASIFSKEDFKGPSHNTLLGMYVDEALSFADSHAIPVDAVAVSCGPEDCPDGYCIPEAYLYVLPVLSAACVSFSAQISVLSWMVLKPVQGHCVILLPFLSAWKG